MSINVFDLEYHELFIQTREALHLELQAIGDEPVSKEVEIQLRFMQDRMLAECKQRYSHALSEISGLMAMLKASQEKPET